MSSDWGEHKGTKTSLMARGHKTTERQHDLSAGIEGQKTACSQGLTIVPLSSQSQAPTSMSVL